VFFLNYETKFLISLIFKKISKDNLKKKMLILTKKKKKKKTKNVRQKKKKIRKKNIRGKLTFIKHITLI
jgi:hypothetical protein